MTDQQRQEIVTAARDHERIYREWQGCREAVFAHLALGAPKAVDQAKQRFYACGTRLAEAERRLAGLVHGGSENVRVDDVIYVVCSARLFWRIALADVPDLAATNGGTP